MREMNWGPVIAFASRHKDGLELFAIAGAVTMRKTLPWPFNRIEPLEWSYEWFREAVLTLISLRGPIPHGPEIQSSERVKKNPDGGVESVKESTVSGSTVAAEVSDSKDGTGPHA